MHFEQLTCTTLCSSSGTEQRKGKAGTLYGLEGKVLGQAHPVITTRCSQRLSCRKERLVMYREIVAHEVPDAALCGAPCGEPA